MDVEEELRSPVTREELDQMGQEEIERHSDPESEEGIQEWEGITCIREITGMVVMDDKRASQISRALAQGMEPEFVAEVFDIQQREVERILSGAEELKKAHRQAIVRNGKRLTLAAQNQLLKRIEEEPERVQASTYLAIMRDSDDLVRSQETKTPQAHLHAHAIVDPNQLLAGLIQGNPADAQRFDDIQEAQEPTPTSESE
tara:strand:- start:643 stop:1245 length:603 start_codon:yes stop_codon:yes gene_type:complete